MDLHVMPNNGKNIIINNSTLFDENWTKLMILYLFILFWEKLNAKGGIRREVYRI